MDGKFHPALKAIRAGKGGGATASGWADHGGHRELRDLLREM